MMMMRRFKFQLFKETFIYQHNNNKVFIKFIFNENHFNIINNYLNYYIKYIHYRDLCNDFYIINYPNNFINNSQLNY